MNYCVDSPDGELEFRNGLVLLQPDKEDMIATETHGKHGRIHAL